MGSALERHFPDAEIIQGMGGSSYWVRLADGAGIDTDQLADIALDHGIMIEPGSVYFHDSSDHSCFRLGFSSIDHSKIDAGLERLAELASRRPAASSLSSR